MFWPGWRSAFCCSLSCWNLNWEGSVLVGHLGTSFCSILLIYWPTHATFFIDYGVNFFCTKMIILNYFWSVKLVMFKPWMRSDLENRIGLIRWFGFLLWWCRTLMGFIWKLVVPMWLSFMAPCGRPAVVTAKQWRPTGTCRSVQLSTGRYFLYSLTPRGPRIHRFKMKNSINHIRKITIEMRPYFISLESVENIVCVSQK